MKLFEKIYKVIATDLPEKMAYFSEFFHLMFFQLILGNAFRFVRIRHICKVYIIDTCAAKTHPH